MGVLGVVVSAPAFDQHSGLMQGVEDLPVEMTYESFAFGDQPQMIITTRDITARKKEEDEKQKIREKFEKAERMESIGILAGGVAHDLNNMLGPVVGYTDLISMDLDDDNPIKKKIERIGKSARDATSVIQDLLTLARRGRYKMTPINLNEVLESYLNSPGYDMLAQAHQNVDVRLKLDTNIDNIKGSCPHLEKVIMNLVMNAYDAMPESGELTIETSQQYLEKLLNGHDDFVHGNYVLLRVQDNGIGIQSEDLNKIFEPYYSKKKMGSSGTGLGLSVVYGIVKDHKGYYDILSTTGKGTEFILYFPISRELVEAKQEAATTTGGNELVLIVDDIKEQREMAKELLSKIGYKVRTVENGRQAIRYLKDHHVDIVVLDMMMEKDFDGLDTYREIIRLNAKQKVVVVSGFSADDRVLIMQRLGAGQYLK